MLCPCLAVGVGQKSLRLICLIATILAVTTRLGQPLAGSDDFVLSLSEKAQLIGTVCVCVCVCLCVFVCVCVSKIEPRRHWFVFGGTYQIVLSCLYPLFHGRLWICVFWACLCLCVRILCVCVWVCVYTHNMASCFPGQTLSFCACHILLSVAHTPFLNSPHSLVASNVNPDAHKQHLSKWHPIHYTPLHTKKGEYNHLRPHTQTQQFLVWGQILSLISLTANLSF